LLLLPVVLLFSAVGLNVTILMMKDCTMVHEQLERILSLTDNL